MTQSQRQAAFERTLAEMAKRRARRLGLVYAGTVRQLAPPPLPGTAQAATKYYLNAVSRDGKNSGITELGAKDSAALVRAERWVEDGIGPIPAIFKT